MPFALTVSILTGCTDRGTSGLKKNVEVDSLRNQIKELTAGNEMIAQNLARFDTLDYTVFSNQQWERLHESHSKDVKVTWPDGHTTTGIDQHLADLKGMFVNAPNTSIKQHPIRFGSGNMTCVTGIMTGTFSAPFPTGTGTSAPSEGKMFSLPMCTIGIWQDGVMIEEFLFWDNQAYMNQIGQGK